MRSTRCEDQFLKVKMKGFSPRNLKYRRAFAEAWPDEQMVQQLAAQIPWFHNCVVLDRVKSPAEREWYIRPQEVNKELDHYDRLSL
jgi:predicted nuclease of restriction endonuclease-like (RecB) superfamily